MNPTPNLNPQPEPLKKERVRAKPYVLLSITGISEPLPVRLCERGEEAIIAALKSVYGDAVPVVYREKEGGSPK